MDKKKIRSEYQNEDNLNTFYLNPPSLIYF